VIGQEASALCDDQLDCAKVLPGASEFLREDDARFYTARDDLGQVVGWVGISTEIVDIVGYSGKPLVTGVGFDTEGKIRGVEIIRHSEPILLVGIPEQRLTDFTNEYLGLPATARVSVGGSSSDPEDINIDAISGATVTVLAEDRTIMETARQIGVATGVIEAPEPIPGHWVKEDTPWTWAQMEDAGVFGRLTVSQAMVGADAYSHGSNESGRPFIDMFFTFADAPQVGRALLGDNNYAWAMDRLKEGEHLFVVMGRGISSFRGSGFVRGGIFDRIRVEQGLTTVVFTDRDYTRLNKPRAEGSPQFDEAAIFRIPARTIDPGMPYSMIFLASRFTGKGGIEREFKTFRTEHRMPKRVYKLDGPDPEQKVWRAAWRVARGKAALLAVFLLAVVGVFIGRRWSTGDMTRLVRLRVATMIVAFLGLGVFFGVQPSVTQILTFIESVVHKWRWGLFLSEPLLVVFWAFIAITTLIWGRGVFCGWACPYGSLNELLFKIGEKLKLPHFELPERIHKPLRWLRYVVFVVLVITFFFDPVLGEKMAEIEPFKSTFYVPAWTRPIGFFVWWAALLVLSVFWFRPFCRYLCPMGAALAIPSSLRLSGPYRREFCTQCKICPRQCEPRAIRSDGTIDSRECLSCMECEANYRDDQVCPPLITIHRIAKSESRTRNRGDHPVSRISSVIVWLMLVLPGLTHAETHRIDDPSQDLQDVLDRAEFGDTVIVGAGIWTGNFTLRESITLRGEGAVLDGGGEGTVLTVDAPGATIENLQIQASGDDRGGPDCCIYTTPASSGAVVRSNELLDCGFGIWVHQSKAARILDNRVVGRSEQHPSRRGNGIHLFDTTDLVVRGNHVNGARDGIYVSAVNDSVIEGNRVENQRFGIHYMYSQRNILRGNQSNNNNSGIALMQSSDLTVVDNYASGNKGHGILFRDAQRCTISGNELVDNAEGMFFYSSTENVIVDNRMVGNEVGAKIWAGTLRNELHSNSFIGNRKQVHFVSSSDLELGTDGPGNYWSDYLGWDQDSDGFGDRPYRVDSFTANLFYQYPVARLLMHSPSLELLGHLQADLPFLRVPTIVDRSPLLEEPR